MQSFPLPANGGREGESSWLSVTPVLRTSSGPLRRMLQLKLDECTLVASCNSYKGLQPVVKVVMCSRGGSASEVETHKNIDSVLHTKTTFQAHSIFSVSIQK